MPIIYFESTRTFVLQSKNATYAFSVEDGGFLRHQYFGARISGEDAAKLNPFKMGAAFSVNKPELDYSFDTVMAEYPCFGSGDCRQSALQIQNANGNCVTDVRYLSHKIYNGKLPLDGLPATYAAESEAQTLEVVALDSASGAEVTLFYTVFPEFDAFCRHAEVKNTGSHPVVLRRALSGGVDLPSMDYDMIHLYGMWAKERNIERTPVIHGLQSVCSRRGSSSHHHNPFMALAAKDANEETGSVYGFSFIYSGNFTIDCEADYFGTTRVVAGIDPGTFSWTLDPADSFCTPELVMVYSDNGIGGMSRRFHKLYRRNLCRGEWQFKERPILINNWEATYFDFNADKLTDIAKTAKELGIEMLVMDDGWFGKRDSDNCSLGDWTVNEAKLGCSLHELVERVNALGLEFGIWFEPEMISPDSDLYRAHPDWALSVPGHVSSHGRQQLVLDMSRKDVQDYLFDSISRILDSANIIYVKWDFNRNLSEVGSALLPAGKQSEIYHRYVLGLYSLLDRLLTAFPHLLLEGCSGGGGRYDPAWLCYSPQFWTSDDTDAIERLSIQFGTSLVYPSSTMSAHVSACPNHQTGRTVPFDTRGKVAMAGAFGYELDLTTLTDEEKELVKAQVQTYHDDFDTIQNGDHYRLIYPDARGITAWEYVSADKSRAVVTYVVTLGLKSNPTQKMLRLRGLDPDAVYVDGDGKEYHGDTLMNAGLNISGHYPDFSAYTVHLTKKI